MELSSLRHSSSSQPNSKTQSTLSAPNMSTATLTMRPSMAFDRPLMGDRYLRDRPSEKIELPPIRTAVPEINQARRSGHEHEHQADWSSHSPTDMANSEYISSPSSHKRRRPSEEEADIEMERPRYNVPRCQSPPGTDYRSQSITISPIASSRQGSSPSDFSDVWVGSSRSSPRMTPGGFPPLRSALSFERTATQPSWKPVLPSLLSIDRGTMNASSGRPDYPLDPAHQGPNAYPQLLTSTFDPSPPYHHAPPIYGYHQPRGQSYSGPSTLPLSHDRTPFSNNHHNGYPGSGSQYNNTEPGNDNKQRKRRGNLPKETTDKLRAWFVSHLQHPYPTEDEKQELMRQTGLQINQISNWFINARRRQLPAMINNARAESDARSARDVNSDYGDDRRNSVPLSEGESVYDGDFETSRRGHSMRMNRESV